MFREQDVDFEQQLNRYRSFLSGDQAKDTAWHQRAHRMQALVVQDALLELMTAAIAVSGRWGSGEPYTHLRFGVGRRAKTLWLSLRGLLKLAPPDRTDPLPHDGVDEVARDLNVIYINIRGLLDNLAWAAVHFAGNDRTKGLPNSQVGLFRKALGKDENLQSLVDVLQDYREWDTELAARRDPAAHRIPLSVSPSFVGPQEAAKLQELNEEWQLAQSDAVKEILAGRDGAAAFERAHAIFDQMETVGNFVPWFHHHYSDGHYAIYPTVPQDLAMMIKISARVFEFFEAQAVKAAN